MTEAAGSRTFFEAFEDKYLAQLDDDCFGMVRGPLASSSARDQFAMAKTRKAVSLEDYSIISTNSEQQSLASLCPKLEDLNLSGNQIADWTTVTDIIQGCENLRVLNVSGNPLAPESISQFVPPPSLRVLVFQRVNASWDDIAPLSSLPNIQELHVGLNQITALQGDSVWGKLELINLHGNQLENWHECAEYFKAACPQLKKVILSSNTIRSISKEDVVPTLESLSLEGTALADWASIDALNLFPQLKEVRVKNVPLVEDLSDLSARYTLIGRLGGIEKLNGSEIRQTERKDAEKYYLQQCHAEFVILSSDEGKEQFASTHPRYTTLLEQYGEPQLSGNSDEPSTLAGGLIKITLNMDGEKHERELPSSMTIGNLKTIISHLFKIGASEQILFYHREADLSQTVLDDDQRNLNYYGITDKGTILIQSKNA